MALVVEALVWPLGLIFLPSLHSRRFALMWICSASHPDPSLSPLHRPPTRSPVLQGFHIAAMFVVLLDAALITPLCPNQAFVVPGWLPKDQSLSLALKRLPAMEPNHHLHSGLRPTHTSISQFFKPLTWLLKEVLKSTECLRPTFLMRFIAKEQTHGFYYAEALF